VTLQPEIDILEPLGARMLVVGLTDLVSGMQFYSLFPKYGPLMAIDPGTGNTVWSVEREKDYALGYTVVAREPLLVLHKAKREGGGASFIALEIATGKTAWKMDLGSGARFVVDRKNASIVVANPGDDTLIAAYETATGARRWAVPRKQKAESAIQLFMSGGDVLMCGRELWAFSPADGSTRWTLPMESMITVSASAKQGTVLGCPGALRLVSLNGKEMWRLKIDGTPGIAVISGNVALVEYLSADGVPQLGALSLEKGAFSWSHPVPGGVKSAIRIINGRVYYSTAAHLIARDLGSGTQVFSVPVPGNSDQDRLADHLVPMDTMVVLLGEQNAMAVNPATGAALWRIELPTARVETFNSAFAAYTGVSSGSRTKGGELPLSVALKADQKMRVRFNIQFQDPLKPRCSVIFCGDRKCVSISSSRIR